MRSSIQPQENPLEEATGIYLGAAALAAPRLTALAVERGLTSIKERDHLQPVYRRALEEVARSAIPPPDVSASLAHGLTPEWPALGLFDISLYWSPTTRVPGELKCGSARGDLDACAWDLAKCAFCLRHGVGVGMLLVAAAPLGLWEERDLGLEFLFDGHWDMSDVRSRYARGFRKWERDGFKPLRVPRHIATVEVSRVLFTIAGGPWLLGIALASPIGEAWLEWEPFLPAKGA